jgi:hypothetical protein
MGATNKRRLACKTVADGTDFTIPESWLSVSIHPESGTTATISLIEIPNGSDSSFDITGVDYNFTDSGLGMESIKVASNGGSTLVVWCQA